MLPEDVIRGEHEDRPFVVVKFSDRVQLPYEDGVEKFFGRMQVGPWEQLQGKFPGVSLRRLYTAVEPGEINKLVETAARLDPSYRPVNMLAYFAVEAPPGTDLDALAEALAAWPSVETAYVDRPAPDPVVNAADDPRAASQGYLNAAPQGIDARFAWPKPDGTGFAGGDGAGQRVIDLERGWTLNHEDLAAHAIPPPLHGVLLDTSRDHGTAVLGEICAADNALGCVGITPAVASVRVVSFNGSTRPNAIMAAISNLSFGDVLLLEAQVTVAGGLFAPIEAFDAEFDAIRLATALGIVVVEAGGNGDGVSTGLDLDTFTNPAGRRILFRDATNPHFRDSGAIIVTAATSAAPHTRMPWAPFGRRVDCYAWGENINTCASNPTGATNLYQTGFNGTSGASPIVTGAALAVQGMAQAAFGYRFSPRQLRAILSNPATGTPRAATETRLIGVMPDLRAIINSVLNVTPDVYIRDFVGDTGAPHAGAVSASPDIILRTAMVAGSPQAAFGAGSGTENSATLGHLAERGHDNYIYVRVLNRGGAAAAGVTATVFWSPVASLVTPDMWTRIGTVTIPSVPTGNQLTVSPALTWPRAAIPATGRHFCFVGLIGTAADPAPDPAAFLNWDNFVRFIRENNNVTWRNFEVEGSDPSVDPNVPAGFVALEFIAPGAPDRDLPMRLEIAGRLPQGARVLLEAPLDFIGRLGERTPFVEADDRRGVGRIRINPSGDHPLNEAIFPAKSRTPLRLLVHIPEALRENAYDVAVRQLWEGMEVGRVNWRLVRRPEAGGGGAGRGCLTSWPFAWLWRLLRRRA